MNLLYERDLRALCETESRRAGDAEAERCIRKFLLQCFELLRDGLADPRHMPLIALRENFIVFVDHDGFDSRRADINAERINGLCQCICPPSPQRCGACEKEYANDKIVYILIIAQPREKRKSRGAIFIKCSLLPCSRPAVQSFDSRTSRVPVPQVISARSASMRLLTPSGKRRVSSASLSG